MASGRDLWLRGKLAWAPDRLPASRLQVPTNPSIVIRRIK